MLGRRTPPTAQARLSSTAPATLARPAVDRRWTNAHRPCMVAIMPSRAQPAAPVHFVEHGRGPEVVLLHAGGSSARQWRHLMDRLSDRYHVLAPDFYGHGETAAWPQPDWPTLDDYAAVVDLIRSGKRAPLHLVGHSHGGSVALQFAAANSDAVTSLTLIEPTIAHILRLNGDHESWLELHDLGARCIELTRLGEALAVADLFMPYWVGAQMWASMPEARRATVAASMPAVAQFWHSALEETTPTETYSALPVPVLLLMGTLTAPPARDIIGVLDAILPNRRLAEIAGAGHMAPMTHAHQVNEIIDRFIVEHS